jgi:hypothetical protein
MSDTGSASQVAVGEIKEGVTAPLVPLENLVQARLDGLAREQGAQIQALRELLARADSLTATQASALSQTVTASATALEQRVNASAQAAAAAVEQTRNAFEKSVDKIADAALTSTLAVRREVELREEFNRQREELRAQYAEQSRQIIYGGLEQRVELARASHEAEHTRIREIDERAQIVRAAKDADSNEWRHTVEGLITGLVSNQVLDAKLDAVAQRISLSERTALDREAIATRDMNRRVTDLETAKNENNGGRTALLAAAALTLTIVGLIITVVFFIILHH